MPGFFGAIRCDRQKVAAEALMKPLDRFGLCSTATMVVSDDVQLGAAHLRDAPLKGKRHFENERWAIVFSGDVTSIGSSAAFEDMPWCAIVEILDGERYSDLAEWHGAFAICALEKSRSRVLVISDRRSQSPVFYLRHKTGFYTASDLSVFCRLPDVSHSFNPGWLYDCLFFCYPILQDTFLADVLRMPPASVLEYSMQSRELKLTAYSRHFGRREPLMNGREALDRAREVFATAVPRLYAGANSAAHALSGGWDSRMLLAFRRTGVPVTTYTYGGLGCRDMLNARSTAAVMGLPHRAIPYDDEFVENLRTYLHDAVFLSGGLQSISRATLLHVYSRLTNFGRKFPLVIGGILGGQICRGEGFTVPSIVSPNLAQILKIGRIDVGDDPYRRALGPRYDEFKSHVEKRLAELSALHGPFDDPQFHLSLAVYEMATKYFVGEMAIAGQFTTYRPAYLDTDILDYAYSSELSTLTFSLLKHGGPWRGENNIMYADLIASVDPVLASLPANVIPPAVLLKGKSSETAYRVFRHYPRRLVQKVRRIGAPLEDWQGWLAGALRPVMDDLLSGAGSMIAEYLDTSFIDDLRQSDPSGHFSRITATAEIVLRLINSSWEKPTETPIG